MSRNGECSVKGFFQWTAAGNLGRDAETRQVGSTTVCNFSVGANLSFKKSDGSIVERTEWVRCTLWGRFAEAMAPHLKKGTGVLVSGEPKTHEYEDRDGNKRSSTDLQVDKLLLLGDSKRGNGERREEQPSGGRGYGKPADRDQRKAPPADDFGYGPPDDDGGDDLLPF
jgi:single-strand DNA-binding protein